MRLPERFEFTITPWWPRWVWHARAIWKHGWADVWAGPGVYVLREEWNSEGATVTLEL